MLPMTFQPYKKFFTISSNKIKATLKLNIDYSTMEQPKQFRNEEIFQSHNDLDSININSDDSRKVNYGQEFNTHILEQYKLYVEMADRVSSRRVQLTSFYTSILSALLALLTITNNKDLFQGSQNFVILMIAILGLCLCIAWAANINSYKQLNSLKFKVIHEMELHLPFPCYKREWDILTDDKKHKKHYFRLTAVEKYVPILLAIPYLCLLIYAIIKIVNS